MNNKNIENNSPKESTLAQIENKTTALLIIDVQERLITSIKHKEIILYNIKKLIEAVNILKVEKFFSEQNPEKLGPTSNLIGCGQEIHAHTKMSFSCISCTELITTLKERNIENLILCGVESHICVQQTAIDLRKTGFNIFITIDAIGSRKEIDHLTAIRRMEHAGIVATTTESAIFELCRTAERKEFKLISNLIKETKF